MAETPSIEMYIQQLAQPDDDIHEAAIDALVAMGANVVDPLIDLIGDDAYPSKQRYRSALVVGRVGTAHTVERLLAMLPAADSATTSYIAAALGEVSNPDAIPPLLEAMQTDDDNIREWVTGALGRTADERVIPVLSAALADKNPWIRCSAVWGLGEVGQATVGPLLVEVLHDKSEQVRMLAINALGQLRVADAAAPLANMLRDDNILVRREASGALVQIGSPACSFVAPMLSPEKDTTTRELAALVMRWTSDPSVVGALTAALRDESAYVRRQAARALGRLRNKTAIPPLRDLLQDPDQDIRRTAEISLKKLGFRPEDS